MIIFRIFAIFAALAGAVGGYLRISEQAAYEPSGLAIPGDPYRLAVIIISGVVLLAAIVISVGLVSSARRDSALVFIRPERPVSLVYFASLGAFSLGALFEILGCIGDYSATRLISGILLFFAAVGMIMTAFLMARADFSSDYSMFVLIPTFWAAYYLILHFRAETQNPVMISYIFEISALVFLVLTFFFQAGILFRRRYQRRCFFSAVMCLYLCILCLISDAPGTVSEMANRAGVIEKLGLLSQLFIFLGGALFAGYVLACLLRSHVPSLRETEEKKDAETEAEII